MPQRNAERRHQTTGPAPAVGSDGAATLGSGLVNPAPDSTGGVSAADATHIDGALATHPARDAAADPIVVPLALGAVTQFAVMLSDQPETLSGGVALDSIQIMEPGDGVTTLESLGADVTAAPSPRGFLDPVWLARRAPVLASMALDATPVVWTDPASVAGSAVLVIGEAMLVLSNWPPAA